MRLLPSQAPEATIDEGRAHHIFRNAEGHFRDDTEANRQRLLQVVSKPTNFLGTDRAGNDWYAETLADGTQIWARVRNGKIVNGGINPIARERLPR